MLAAGVVKFMYQRGVFGETLRGGDFFDAVVVPQTVTGAEGLNAGFCGNARAGEDTRLVGWVMGYITLLRSLILSPQPEDQNAPLQITAQVR